MITIDLTQDSDKWLAWRKKGISATDSPVILGDSPYKTPWRLWAEKTGKCTPPDLSGNPHVRRGNRLEPLARQWFEKKHAVMLLPVCGEYSGNPIFRASFDGVNDQGEPVELKGPSDKQFEEIARLKEKSTAYMVYQVQVQHQLLVTEAERGWLVFYHETEEPIVFEVKRDQAMIDDILEKGIAFWNFVKGKGEPELDPARDLFSPAADQEKEWNQAARMYRQAEKVSARLNLELKALKEEMKQAEGVLVNLMGEFQKAEHDGVAVSRFQRSGTIDYKKFLFDSHEVDELKLETFRRKSSHCVRISGDPNFLDEIRTGTDSKTGWF